ncbi:WD40 repeat-like protein [Russula earlei]|uniref:WD40 repeat-like protein n=1 Tax=Russula earlei TaxID=71964 RepID=A0ACC0UP16_9AGAM|nr:WD40 repeat-like protein [Russula earlei]
MRTPFSVSRTPSSSYSPQYPPRLYNDSSDDFDIIDGSPFSVQRTLTITRPPSPSSSFDFSIINLPSSGPDRSSYPFGSLPGRSQPQLFSPPRWSASSTGRRYNTAPGSPSSYRVALAPSDNQTSQTGKSMKCLLPRLWGALSSPSRKSRRKAGRRKPYTLPSNIGYADLQPLDGEEGELIDEACFVDHYHASQSPPIVIDFLSYLPFEIAIYLLCFLDLSSVIACQSVSRTWNVLANDNAVWRELFYRRQGPPIGMRDSRTRTLVHTRSVTRAPSPWSPEHPSDSFLPLTISMNVPLSLPWRELYQTRYSLDERWASSDPQPSYLSGHDDSVYCLEFDSKRIISGSRDQSIKVWDFRTGRCLGTFRGHYGSVLCLKFEKDWDIMGHGKKGFMVSGSSDRRACVWDIWIEEGGEVRAEVRAVLRGHLDGVLDLRVDEQWIVSCSKDTKIRVWNRKTLELHRTFSGHEGPVNAIGLQNGLIVSASGDTKMMLWDIERGTCLRTFDGHDRGLACIEFKDNYIVSGSSDCNIKVWDAMTGECIRTLVGHDALVRALALDPASGRLVSASYDKVVKVWDLRTGRTVRQFKRHHLGHIFDVKFDVHRIVSTSHDRRIVVLDFTQNLDTALFT